MYNKIRISPFALLLMIRFLLSGSQEWKQQSYVTQTLFFFSSYHGAYLWAQKKKWDIFILFLTCLYQELFIDRTESSTNTNRKNFHGASGLGSYVLETLINWVVALFITRPYFLGTYLAESLLFEQSLPPVSAGCLWCLVLSGIIFKMRVWEEKRKCVYMLHPPLIQESFSTFELSSARGLSFFAY